MGTSGCAFKLSFNAGTTDETINKAPKNAKAWVIATPPATQSINVEDEDGEEITQEINTGSEILLGKNVDIQTGEAVAMPTFYIKEKLLCKSILYNKNRPRLEIFNSIAPNSSDI